MRNNGAWHARDPAHLQVEWLQSGQSAALSPRFKEFARAPARAAASVVAFREAMRSFPGRGHVVRRPRSEARCDLTVTSVSSCRSIRRR